MAAAPDPLTGTVPPVTRRYRHAVFVRATHWINAACILILLPTGVEIFGHHPELYWREIGFFGDPFFLSLGKAETEYFGIGMGTARTIHFLAAWMLVLNAFFYMLLASIRGHVSRNLLPDRDQLAPRQIRAAIVDHLHLRHDEVDAGRRYNLVQKLAYLVVIFVFGPLIVMTGLAMSPAITAQYPFLIEMFGGRQTARTVHFLIAAAFVAFLLIHVWQVWLVGFRREMRSMVTGWYHLPDDGPAR